MKRFLFVILLAPSLYGQVVVQAILPGLWSNPATWNGGVVPGANDEEVIITQPVFLDQDITKVHNIRIMRQAVNAVNATITGCPAACLGTFTTATQNPRFAVGSRITLNTFTVAALLCINSTTPTVVLTNASATQFTANVPNTCANVASTSNAVVLAQYGHLCSYDGTHASTEADCVHDRIAARSIKFDSTGTSQTGTGTGANYNPDSSATMFGIFAADRSPDTYDTVHLTGPTTIPLTIDSVNGVNRWYFVTSLSNMYSGGCATLGTAGCTGGSLNTQRGPSVTLSGLVTYRQGNQLGSGGNPPDGFYLDHLAGGGLIRPVFSLTHSHLIQFTRFTIQNIGNAVINSVNISYNWFDDPKVPLPCGSYYQSVICSVTGAAPAANCCSIDHNTMTAGPDTLTNTYFTILSLAAISFTWTQNAIFGPSDGSAQVGAFAEIGANFTDSTTAGGNTITNNLAVNAEGAISVANGTYSIMTLPCTSNDTTTIIQNNILLGQWDPLFMQFYGPCGSISNNYIGQYKEANGLGQMRGLTNTSTNGCPHITNNIFVSESANSNNNGIFSYYSTDSSANSCFYADNNDFLDFTQASDGTTTLQGFRAGDNSTPAGTPTHTSVFATVNSTFTNSIIAYLGTGTNTPTSTIGIMSTSDNNTWLTTKCANSVGVCNNVTYAPGPWTNYSLCNTSVCVPNPTGGTGFDNGTVRHPATLYGDIDGPSANPNFYDITRHGLAALAQYDSRFCSGPGTVADLATQFANRWNGTNNACTDVSQIYAFISRGFRPYNLMLKGAGNGKVDIGVMPNSFPAAIL